MTNTKNTVHKADNKVPCKARRKSHSEETDSALEEDVVLKESAVIQQSVLQRSQILAEVLGEAGLAMKIVDGYFQDFVYLEGIAKIRKKRRSIRRHDKKKKGRDLDVKAKNEWQEKRWKMSNELMILFYRYWRHPEAAQFALKAMNRSMTFFMSPEQIRLFLSCMERHAVVAPIQMAVLKIINGSFASIAISGEYHRSVIAAISVLKLHSDKDYLQEAAFELIYKYSRCNSVGDAIVRAGLFQCLWGILQNYDQSDVDVDVDIDIVSVADIFEKALDDGEPPLHVLFVEQTPQNWEEILTELGANADPDDRLEALRIGEWTRSIMEGRN